jgi:hypothetical protein
VGVLALLADHAGFALDRRQPWWRLAGRLAPPIFFFLVGFARSRRVPWTWPVLGALLTAAYAVALDVTMLNVLVSFALLRGVALPLAERHVLARPWATAIVAGLSVALGPVTDRLVEYGTVGWLWALFGLSHRLRGEPGRARVVTSGALGVLAALAYAVGQARDHALGGLPAAALAGGVMALLLALLRFRRTVLPWQPAEPAATLLRLCGRRSLAIYAVSLLGVALLARVR